MNDNEMEAALQKLALKESGFAVAYALMRVASAQRSVAYQLGQLGNGNASTEMGAIESLSVTLKDGLDGIASAISCMRAIK